MEDELRSAGKSLDLDSNKDRASGPWGVVTWVLGIAHAAGVGALKALQGAGLSAENLGAATGAVVLFVCVGGIIAILCGSVFGWIGKLLKLGTHTRNALALVFTLAGWWIAIAALLGVSA